MRDLSLHLLDLTQNSVTAGASLVEILLTLEENGWLTMVIRDDGRGMSPELLARVTSPFATTRTTRKVGMGIPLFRMAAEMTGGFLDIVSQPGKGTVVTASFHLSHIDRMPLGDMIGTITALIRLNPDVDFVYCHTVDDRSFQMDTREMREQLGDVPLCEPDVMEWIDSYLRENENNLGGTA